MENENMLRLKESINNNIIQKNHAVIRQRRKNKRFKRRFSNSCSDYEDTTNLEAIPKASL